MQIDTPVHSFTGPPPPYPPKKGNTKIFLSLHYCVIRDISLQFCWYLGLSAILSSMKVKQIWRSNTNNFGNLQGHQELHDPCVLSYNNCKTNMRSKACTSQWHRLWWHLPWWLSLLNNKSNTGNQTGEAFTKTAENLQIVVSSVRCRLQTDSKWSSSLFESFWFWVTTNALKSV